MTPPETRYARSGEMHIAYQVMGEGPFDLVFLPGVASHLEIRWEEPSLAHACERLARFSRLIMYDKRGTGLSDRSISFPTFEEQMDDLQAVLEATGAKRPALFGILDGGTLAALFAAMYPKRTRALVTYSAVPKLIRSDDYPVGFDSRMWDQWLSMVDADFGLATLVPLLAPSRAEDEGFKAWYARYYRMSAGPGALVSLGRMMAEIDIRPILPTIRVPTLILHRLGDRWIDVGHARYLAENIPGAKLVELEGEDNLYWAGDVDAMIDEIEMFLTGGRASAPSTRVLSTVLFTDIVSSTEQAAKLGDRRWNEVVDRHDRIVRAQLKAFQGREVKSVGDGFLATFDGPARAIRCARAIVSASGPLGVTIRAGLHTGEVEMAGNDVRGIGVHIAARVTSMADSNEVLVSSTVKDLVAGSGIEFEDRGAHSLKGVPGEWRIFAVTSA